MKATTIAPRVTAKKYGAYTAYCAQHANGRWVPIDRSMMIDAALDAADAGDDGAAKEYRRIYRAIEQHRLGHQFSAHFQPIADRARPARISSGRGTVALVDQYGRIIDAYDYGDDACARSKLPSVIADYRARIGAPL